MAKPLIILMQKQILVINDDTINVFKTTRECLFKELKRLVEILKDHPLICIFAQYRFVFENEHDIIDLIAKIDNAINQYNYN